jgi:hypothetical protein
MPNFPYGPAPQYQIHVGVCPGCRMGIQIAVMEDHYPATGSCPSCQARYCIDIPGASIVWPTRPSPFIIPRPAALPYKDEPVPGLDSM